MMFFNEKTCQEERRWGGATCACARCERLDWRSLSCLWPQSHAAANDAVEKFYKGRTITSVVPFGPGGGYAIYNQIMARHLGKFIPGNPQIVPQYRPGAGGIVASNYVYNVAPRDGSVMAMVSDSVALASVIDADKAKYKVNEFIWLGAIERVNNVLAVRADTGVRTFKDMLEKEVAVGGSGPGSPTSLLPSLLRWLEPVKIRTIEGYDGINPMFIAIERNEISGATVSWTIFKTLRKQWFDSGFLVPIVQFGSVKEKDLPNVPLAHRARANAGAAGGRALHGVQCRRRALVHPAAGGAGGARGRRCAPRSTGWSRTRPSSTRSPRPDSS